MNVLFICRHNRFRSKVAEAFFKKLNKNKKKNKVRSRGLIKDIDVADNVIKVMKEKGIVLRDKKSHKLTEKDFEWADLIVIVADNVSLELKKFKKNILTWKISDTDQSDIRGIRKRVDVIEKKILNLLKIL